MTLEEEIRRYFFTIDENCYKKLNGVDDRYPAWSVRFPGRFGVAVPYNGDVVNEEFASVQLYSEHEPGVSGEYRDFLLLTSSIEQTREKFASFCCSFVDPGIDGAARDRLLSDPAGWWRDWKLLIGNSIVDKQPFAVLGELAVYEYLLEEGEEVKWCGPEASSHDLECPCSEIEVKSTLKRYESIIHVSGQFQFQSSTGHLYLYFCRFEKNSNGICIDSVARNLVDIYGQPEAEINGKLSRLGYAVGNSSRRERYYLHEIRKYEVDDHFPRITPEMFKGNRMPEGIVQVSYDVNLSSLAGNTVDTSRLRL